MIKDGTYSEFADQMIGEIRNAGRLHGGNFANILFHDKYHAARVYKEAAEFFGPFATAAEFAGQCDWNTHEDARQFVQSHQVWPPDAIVDELQYM